MGSIGLGTADPIIIRKAAIPTPTSTGFLAQGIESYGNADPAAVLFRAIVDYLILDEEGKMEDTK